uniref:Uncharacterized protein n=2 Tax=Lygus hesperus TaxID=30085 RepID=A0A0A9Z4E7_LYGHE
MHRPDNTTNNNSNNNNSNDKNNDNNSRDNNDKSTVNEVVQVWKRNSTDVSSASTSYKRGSLPNGTRRGLHVNALQKNKNESFVRASNVNDNKNATRTVFPPYKTVLPATIKGN